jgi:hypothetical protein
MVGVSGNKSRPAIALGLTFLIIGVAYSLPLRLPDLGSPWAGRFAVEIRNLYSVTAWMGLAHFVYAYRGQYLALRRQPRVQGTYWLALGATILALVLLYKILGAILFSVIAWTYFIGHFVKAETLFGGHHTENSGATFLQPVAAFAWFTAVLFNVGMLQDHRWWLLLGSLALAAVVLLSARRGNLANRVSTVPLLSLFLIGESLVWGTYGSSMTPYFRTGLYIFHIAAASFFHYFGSYAFGMARARNDRWLRLGSILAVNVALICLGLMSVRFHFFTWTKPILGAEYFTFWVALHQLSSDLFPRFRKKVA